MKNQVMQCNAMNADLQRKPDSKRNQVMQHEMKEKMLEKTPVKAVFMSALSVGTPNRTGTVSGRNTTGRNYVTMCLAQIWQVRGRPDDAENCAIPSICLTTEPRLGKVRKI